MQISGKNNGVYYYRVGKLGAGWSVRYSSQITVTVGGSVPPLDNLADQANYQFQLRQGDLNGDGRKDIYIKRSSGGDSNNGVLYETLLQQQSDKSYLPVTSPTSSQLGSGRGWSVFSPTLVLGDYNVDGYIDLFIKGVSVLGSGIHDQIVFSSGQAYNGKAQASTAVDAEFKKFFRDIYNWILDPNYFDAAIAPQQNGLRVKLLQYVSAGYRWCPSRYFCTWITSSSSVGTLYLQDFTASSLNTAIANGLTVLGNGGSDLDDYVGDWSGGGVCYTNWYWGTRACYQWVQSNSVVTLGGGFDGENYSEKAKEFSELMTQLNGSDNKQLILKIEEYIDIEIDVADIENIVYGVISDDENFWGEIMLNILLQNFYCHTDTDSSTEVCHLTVTAPDPNVPSIEVVRTGEGIFEPNDQAIPYTEGVYELLGSPISGVTLERGGPACTSHNCGRRIPEGQYTFSKWTWRPTETAVPILSDNSSDRIRLGARDYILIHSGANPSAKVTVGCILIGKKRGSHPGTLDLPTSQAARLELELYLNAHYGDSWFGYVDVINNL